MKKVLGSVTDYIELGTDLILCELCSRKFSADLFFSHLDLHSRQENMLLRRLAKETMKLTSEEYKDFFFKLEVESYSSIKHENED